MATNRLFTDHEFSFGDKDLDRIHSVVVNAMSSRVEALRQLLETRRDLYHECDYPRSITLNQYQEMYDRESIATRVVEVLPVECWRVTPEAYEVEEADRITTFERAVANLHGSIAGESWYDGEVGSPLWNVLERLDIVSGIGSYGVLFLGLDDGNSLDQPVTRASRLLFTRPLPESLAQISRLDNDVSSPRFGKPELYAISFTDPNAPGGVSGAGVTTSTHTVHWTRVIHVADNVKTSDLYGTPRMEQCFNRLLDLRKLYAGSAEMYWRGAFPGLSIESPPTWGDADLDVADAKSKIQEYFWGLQRFLILRGLTAKQLAPTAVDPTPWIERQLEAIATLIGIPKRILLGSERGELASAQDKDTWGERLSGRRNRYISPRIIAQLLDRLISLGVLPVPASGKYRIFWPGEDSLSEEAKATIALTKAQAIEAYVSSNGALIMDPLSFLTMILGLTDPEAESVLAKAATAVGGGSQDVDAA